MGSDPLTRRSTLKFAGATAVTSLVAGCLDDGEASGDALELNGDDEDDGDDQENGGDDGNGEDDGDDQENGEDDVGGFHPGERVVLEAVTSGWIGSEPAVIEGEQNPRLVLEEGETYEVGWEVGDGGVHNIEIVDGNDEVIDDLSTEDVIDTEPDNQFLEFVATAEMAEYVCRPRPNAMRGPLEIVESGHEDEEGEDGDEGSEHEDEEGEDGETTDVPAGERVVLEAITGGWIGREPAVIEGVENPTLVLEEGGPYAIGWEEGDGGVHNIEIVDDDDEVIDHLSTEYVTDTEPDGQFLEFVASGEMAEYVCRPHPDTMRGSLEIR